MGCMLTICIHDKSMGEALISRPVQAMKYRTALSMILWQNKNSQARIRGK